MARTVSCKCGSTNLHLLSGTIIISIYNENDNKDNSGFVAYLFRCSDCNRIVYDNIPVSLTSLPTFDNTQSTIIVGK